MDKNILLDRRFWPMFFTQFFGAFNDNVFKNSIGILIAFKAYSIGGIPPEQMVSLCGGIFILPFFIFSAISGQLADKFAKPGIVRAVKLLEIAIMVMGMIGFVTGNMMLLLIGLFMMGCHSTLFGPVKYSILPHLLHEDELVAGNAYVETGTFIAILLGSILGVELNKYASGPYLVGSAVILIAVVGFLFSTAIQPIEPVKPDLKVNFNPFTTTFQILGIVREVKSVFLSVLAISWFWFVGFALLSIFPVYCKNFLHTNESVVTLFLALFSIGIGVGSILCEKLSFKRTELGLVPIGSFGISLFAFDLFMVGQPSIATSTGIVMVRDFLHSPKGLRIAIDVFMFSVSSGFFTVPLYTFIQQRPAKENRSRVIAGNNILNALFMVIGSVFLVALYHFKLTYPQIFLILSILNILVAVYIYKTVPEFVIRLVVWGLMNIVYRLKIVGRENIPAEGPYILASNHITFVDSLVISSACPKPARFVMYYKFMTMPLASYVFRETKVIPIAGASENPDILKAAFEKIAFELDDKETICIFPEGALTLDGKIAPFKNGIEKILERNPVPVIPVCLNGLWGSYFSKKYGKGERKAFRRKWSRISVEFGKPIPPEEVTAQGLYDVISKMKTVEV